MIEDLESKTNPNQKLWSVKAKGFKVGHFKNLQEQSFIYPNGSQLVRLYLKGDRAILDRCYLQIHQDGTTQEVEREIFDFGVFNELRFYDTPNIAKKVEGKTYYFTPLHKFMKVLPRRRNPQDQRLFFTYDYRQKLWLVKWSKPKQNKAIELFRDGTYKLKPKSKQIQDEIKWVTKSPITIR